MPYRMTQWTYLVKFEPEKAKRKILQAYKKTKGNAVKAAEVLELSHRSLTRAVSVLKLTEEIDRLRAEMGYQWLSTSTRWGNEPGPTPKSAAPKKKASGAKKS